MAEFKVTIEAVWTNDGSFEDLGGDRMLNKTDEQACLKSDEEME